MGMIQALKGSRPPVLPPIPAPRKRRALEALVVIFAAILGIVITAAWAISKHLIIKPALLVGKWVGKRVGGVLLWAAWESTRGKTRAMWAPMWFGVIVAVPLPYGTAGWLALAVGLDAAGFLPSRSRRRRWIQALTPDRKLISGRERRLLTQACALVALWHDRSPATPMWGSVATLAAIIAGCAVPWWKGRKVRATDHPELVKVWKEVVVPAYPELAGEWRDVTTAAGGEQGGVLRLSTGLASEVAKMDEEVEATIDRTTAYDLPRGALTISAPPGLPSVRDVRVLLARDPRAAVSRIYYWEGPTLKADGSFTAGTTIHGQVVPGRLWRKGGAVNNLLLGGPGSGKGGGTRTLAMEEACSEDVYGVGLDCKYGCGMPELAPGFDHYLITPEEWEIGLLVTFAVLDSRLARYGKHGRSRWSPAIDPLLRLTIDEIQELASKFPKYAGRMEQLAGQGRSLGIGINANTQRGGGEALYSTTFRANLRGNGTTYVGQQGDVTAGMLATQDTMLDLTRLPREPGYMFPVSKVDHDVAPEDAIRWRYSVAQAEVDEDDAKAPFGTVEEWMTTRYIRRATLHEDDLAAIDPFLERLAAICSPVVVPDDGGGAGGEEPVGAGTIDRVRHLLPESGEMTAKEIGLAVGVGERQVRNLLVKLAAETPPGAEKVGANRWRKAS